MVARSRRMFDWGRDLDRSSEAHSVTGATFYSSPEIMTLEVRCQTLGFCRPSETSDSKLPTNGSEMADTE